MAPPASARIMNQASVNIGVSYFERNYSGAGTGSHIFAPAAPLQTVCLWEAWFESFSSQYCVMWADPDGGGGVVLDSPDGFTVVGPLSTSGNLQVSGTMLSGSVPAARIDSGTLNVARSWAYTGGDVTSSAGSAVLTIGNNAVTNAKMAQAAANTLKGNATGSTANLTDIALAANQILGRSSAGNIAAKTVTDLAFNLLDDTTQSAMRSTLGLATIASSGSASDLSTGTVPTARLGTGTADNTTFLVGDQTWKTYVEFMKANAQFFTHFFSGANAIPELTYTSGSGGSFSTAAFTGAFGTLVASTDSSTAGSYASVRSVSQLRFSLFRTRATWYIQPPVKSASDDVACRIGFIDTDNAAPVDGVYFEYDSTISANWRIVTANNSTRTATTTGTAVASGFHLFEIEVNAAGTSAEYFLDGVSLGTQTANIPTSILRMTNAGYHVHRNGGTPSTSYSATADLFGWFCDM